MYKLDAVLDKDEVIKILGSKGHRSRQDEMWSKITCSECTVKFMFIVQIAMYHYDMYVKVAYDNFNNKRRYDDDDAPFW